MNRLMRRLEDGLKERREKGLLREVRLPGDLIDLSNNDYLSLAQNGEVKKAAIEAIEKYGCSSSASPLISGYKEAHDAFLKKVCEWCGFETGMIWNTGFAANQAVLSGLPQKGDLVLADRLIHNSMISGILQSGARLMRYRHLDLEHLESLLVKERDAESIVFVVTESVFSMDGDYPDLKAMATLKERFDFVWLVDEAHASGWYGEKGSGLVEESGVGQSVDVLVGTLGKGLGSMGAYTLFHEEALKTHFENYASEFIYSTYLPPSSVAAAGAAIDLIGKRKNERAWARQVSAGMRARLSEVGLDVMDGDSPILPVILGSVERVAEARSFLEERGFAVGVIRPPTVPEGTSRLRISLKSDLDPSLLAGLAEALEDFAKR
ncbi:MAG: 8-amino-7-oxononanoate synthase [Verrucomicrobiota bacterium]